MSIDTFVPHNLNLLKNSYWLFFFFKILFFPFSPQSPPVHSCTFSVVGPSSCGMRDTAPAQLDEQRQVHAQDPNQRNTGPHAAEHANPTTRPRGQPLILAFCYFVFISINIHWEKNYNHVKVHIILKTSAIIIPMNLLNFSYLQITKIVLLSWALFEDLFHRQFWIVQPLCKIYQIYEYGFRKL